MFGYFTDKYTHFAEKNHGIEYILTIFVKNYICENEK